MAGHSKWHNIKHRKAAQDAKKGKVYSLHAKLIALAAQSWGWDPEQNPNLATIIAKAKADWVPNDNIDRAIKKWTGEDKSGMQIQEIVYEGYAPGWVAMLVRVLTDNKNRTASNIRHIFSKFWGNMGESGAVSWMFKRKGVIIIDSSKYNYDQIEEFVFETTAEDITLEQDIIKIITSIDDFRIVEEFFKWKGIELEASELDYIPDNEIEITEFDKALKFKKMFEAFEEDEDVATISTNEIIPEELEKQVDEFIEKNSFRS